MAVVPFASQVRGVKSGRAVLHEEAQRVQAARLCTVYEEHELTVPSPTTNVSIKTVVTHSSSCSCARASGAFGLIARAQRALIRNLGNFAITVRFHVNDEDPVTIDAGEYLDWNFMEYEDLYLTNTSGSGVPIRVTMA